MTTAVFPDDKVIFRHFFPTVADTKPAKRVVRRRALETPRNMAEAVANAMSEIAQPRATPMPWELAWFSRRIDTGLKNMLAQIVELHSIEMALRPTQQAFEVTHELLFRVGMILGGLGKAFPVGYVMEDEEGGIRIEWEDAEGTKHVRLAIHGKLGDADYIYYEDENGPGLEPVNIMTLAERLIWFAA